MPPGMSTGRGGEDGEYHGRGTLQYTDVHDGYCQSYYEGDFIMHWKMLGQGTGKTSYENEYKEALVLGLEHGRGTYTYEQGCL